MNSRKECCRGLGLNYSISVDRKAYESIKKIREHLVEFNDRHLSIGEVACLLISVAEEIHFPRVKGPPENSPTRAALDKVGSLLKQLEDIVQKEREKQSE